MVDTKNEAVMIEGVHVVGVNIKKGDVEIKIVTPVGAAQEALDLLVQLSAKELPCLLTLSQLQATFGITPKPASDE